MQADAMEKIDATQPYNFVRTVFKIVGLWNPKKSWSITRIIHLLVVQVPFSFAFFLTMMINLASSSNIEDMTECLYMALTKVSMTVKIVNILVKRRKLLQFLDNLNSPLLAPRTLDEVEFFKQSHAKFNRHRNLYLIVCWSCIATGYYASAISDGKKLPFSGWYPFDWRNDRTYFWVIFGYQVVAMSLACTTNASFDLTNAYLFFQTSFFFRLISKRLSALGCNDGKIDSISKKAAISELIHCIQMHQFVRSLVKDAENILTAPIFVQFNVSGIVLCVTAFQITLLSPLEDTGTFFLYFLFIGGMLMQIFLPCYHANELTVDSEFVCTAMYSSNWTEMPSDYRKLMYYFMESLKQTMSVKAGGYVNVGLKALISVIQSAYSLFALLINLKN